MDVNVLTLGLTNSLRTGNVALDMVLSTVMCMLIPFVINHVFTSIKTFLISAWEKFFSKRSREDISRHITTSKFRDQYGGWNNEDKNHILHKAILLYIQNMPNKEWAANNQETILTLLDTERDNFSDSSEDEDDIDADKPKRTLTYLERQIRRLTLTIMPKEEDRIQVEPGLFFSLNNDSGNDNNEDKSKAVKQTTTTITLSSSGPDATKRIDAFVDVAFQYYQNMIASKGKDKRYMLCMSSKPVGSKTNNNNNGEGSGSGIEFTKYSLTEEKTFDSLFLPQKDDLLRLLDDFTLRRGKFSIAGFPKKLGILLHGPPGTGKTSLIKAIAQYTQRHIVSIPLKRIKTNQELMELMFGRQFACQGEDLPMRLPFKKLIFVMEDVDAASEVVRKRDESQSGGSKRKQHHVPRPPTPPSTSSAAAAAATPSHDTDDLETQNITTTTTTMPASSSLFGPDIPHLKWLEPDDELDLAGLLNALDGVVDSPGRIVVMTTNHPDKLDPALIRPGRVNIKLHLGHMQTPQALQMVAHYFEKHTFTDEERQAFVELFPSGHISPARLEEMCAEHDTVPQLLQTLGMLAKGKRLSEFGVC